MRCRGYIVIASLQPSTPPSSGTQPELAILATPPSPATSSLPAPPPPAKPASPSPDSPSQDPAPSSPPPPRVEHHCRKHYYHKMYYPTAGFVILNNHTIMCLIIKYEWRMTDRVNVCMNVLE
jgi:hypothetical protein